MTPRELYLLASIKRERVEAQFEEKITLVWMGEYYHRQEKLKPLKECLEDLKPKKKQEMTDNEMLRMVKRLNAKFGGNVE